jgi:hypothetical protein
MCAVLSRGELRGYIDPFKSIDYLKTTRNATDDGSSDSHLPNGRE